METLLALLVGTLVAAGVWLMLQRDVVRFLFGMVLLGNAVNLVVFTAGRVTGGAAPLIPEGATAPVEALANPVPQALVLTAIVIGFGLVGFALVLAMRTFGELGTLDPDLLGEDGPADPRPRPEVEAASASSPAATSGPMEMAARARRAPREVTA